MAEPPDTGPRPAVPHRGLLNAAAVALAIAALHYGREIFVPLALAVLLAFLLDPLVQRLRRTGLPRVAAIATVVAFALAVAGATSVFVGSQVVELSKDLPQYQDTVQKKLRTLRQAVTRGRMLDDASRMLGVVEGEFDAARRALENTGPRNPRSAVRVQVEPTPQTPLQALGELLEPLVVVGATLVFTIFILLERTELRDRLLRLVGGDLRHGTDALNDAARRVSRYLLMQLVVNLGYGVPMALGLWFIGVPGALLWGLLATVLRFVPYAGPVIAAAFPLTLAFAIDPGWDLLLWTALLVVTIELVSNQFIEPWLYGASTGITPVALLVSAAFWAALWGPVGLVLATPLTVCLVVLGRHLRPLRVFDVLLGSGPVFDPPTRLYQRLLSGDVEEAIEIADEQVRASSLEGFYAETGMPALRLASAEHARLDAEHRHRLVCGMEALLRELRSEHAAAEPAQPTVVCIGLRWEADSLAADMLAHALAASGVAARALPAAAVSAERIAQLELGGAATVCLSCFNPDPATHVRFVARRLRRRWPGLRIVLALWNAPLDLTTPDAPAALEADAVATTVTEAMRQVREGTAAPETESRATAQAQARSAGWHASGAAGQPATLEHTLRRCTDVFDVPVAVLVGAETGAVQMFGATGDNAAAARAFAEALWARVAAEGTGTVDDAARLPQLDVQAGLRFGAAAPLQREGITIGALCIAGRTPRDFTPADAGLLQSLADELVAALAAPPASGAAEAAATAAADG